MEPVRLGRSRSGLGGVMFAQLLQRSIVQNCSRLSMTPLVLSLNTFSDTFSSDLSNLTGLVLRARANVFTRAEKLCLLLETHFLYFD